MIEQVPVSEPAPSTLEPGSSASVPEAQAPEPLEPVPEEPEESQEPEEPEEPPPPPVPKARVPPRVKPKAKPKAESSTPASAPKAKPKAKRAPKKPEPPEDPEPVDRFQAFSNTDLIAEILARTEDRRMEQKRQLYRSFLQ